MSIIPPVYGMVLEATVLFADASLISFSMYFESLFSRLSFMPLAICARNNAANPSSATFNKTPKLLRLFT